MTIQVSNLPFTVTDAQLDNLKASFSSFGKVNKFEVIVTNKSTKVIIVQLESGEDAAIKALNGELLEAQSIEVKGVKEGEGSNSPSPATPPGPPPPPPGPPGPPRPPRPPRPDDDPGPPPDDDLGPPP